MTRTTTIRFLKILLALSIVGIISGYAIWRSMNYARGPEIDIYTPTDGFTATTSTVAIVGRAQRVNNLLLNGKSISVDEQGNFNETIIIFPGINIVTLEAHDRFERETVKRLKLVGY